MTDAHSSQAEFRAPAGPLLGANWRWVVVRGALAILLGVVALLFPGLALIAFALVFAAYAAADGLFSLISGIRGATHSGERWLAPMLHGVVGLAIGAIFVLWPMLGVVGYAVATLVLVSAWAILTGLLEIAAAIRLRREIDGEWLLALSGFVSLALGLVIPFVLAAYPAATILSVAWIIGIYALIAGVALVALGLRLRRGRAA